MNQGIPTLYKFSKNVGDIMKFARHFFIYIFILNCAACVTLNETGQSVFMLTSEEQEKELGEKGYQEVLSKEKIKYYFFFLRNVGISKSSSSFAGDFDED